RTFSLPRQRVPQGSPPRGISSTQSSAKSAMIRSRSWALKPSHSSTSCERMFDMLAPSGGEDWSRGRELNPQPTDYKSVALPLSYPGASGTYASSEEDLTTLV